MCDAGTTSLDGLETSSVVLKPPTPFQRAVFQNRIHQWEKITWAFLTDEGEELQKRGARLNSCITFPTIYIDVEGKAQLSMGRCRDRLCPSCSMFRGVEAANKTHEIVKLMDAPRFLTLTVKHNDMPLRAQVDRLMVFFRELRKTRFWREKVTGGVYALELTLNPEKKQWHPHIHAVIDGKFIPHPALKAIWNEITGDSHIVHLRAVQSRRQIAKYIADYLAKPPDMSRWSNKHIREFATALHSRRMINTFGCYHGKVVDPKPAGPKRDNTRWAPPIEKIKEKYWENHPIATEIICTIDHMGRTWQKLFERKTEFCPKPDAEELDRLKTHLANLLEAFYVEIYPYSTAANKLKTDVEPKPPPEDPKLFDMKPQNALGTR